MRKKNKSIIMAMAVVLAIATIASASTFAWYTASDSQKNRFNNQQWDADGIKVVERFTPPKEWVPGFKVEKAVWLANMGDSTAVVRATLAEVLMHLSDDKFTLATAGYTGIATTAINPDYSVDFSYAATNVPKLSSPAAYASGWTLLTPTTGANLLAERYTNNASASVPVVTTLTNNVPANVDVYYKLKTEVDVFGNVTVTIEFAALYKISDPAGKYNDKYQSVALTVAKTSVYDSSVPPVVTSIGLVLDVDGYKVLPMGALLVDKWETALLATSGLNAPYNGWTPASPAVDATQFLTGDSTLDPMIELVFANVIAGPATSITAADAGKWWFNVADGYFYYLALVPSGGTTAEFLQSVELKSAAGNIYSDLSYDLYVFAHAIQPTKAAVDAQWGSAISAALAAGGVVLA